MTHLITPSIKTLVQRALNAAETGTADGKYDDVSIFAGGKGGAKQITYGRAQATEQEQLPELIRMYRDKGGAFAAQFGPYLPLIGAEPLADDSEFKDLLVRAGKEDALMKETQDEFFDKACWAPAFKWFTKHGFTLPLSMLVIYDSFLHSGGIRPFLRNKFAEPVPAKGGDEKNWIRQYTKARHEWLAGHSERILRKTIYRTNCYLCEIERDNWHLAALPISMNGIAVHLPDALRERPGKSEEPPAVSHLITPPIKTLVQRVLNAAETGSADGKYHDISIFADGKRGTRQITYGKSQTTEQGHLAKLIRMYCEKGGAFAAQFGPYLPLIGRKPLVDDAHFKKLLVRAAKEDPLMKGAQDEFFDKVYWTPAFKWFTEQGFTLPMSMLVIYDSFIHSGSILPFLRKKFAEPVPAQGGDEKKWIGEYVKARHKWLAGHSKPILRKTIYRTNCYLGEIEGKNWHLTVLPIRMNGIAVHLPPALREGPGAIV